MSKSKYISIIIIQFILIFTLVINTNKPKEIMNDNNTKIVKKNKDTISMMLETEAGSGNYEMTTRDSWPTEWYIFNSTLSKCENGGELAWDDTNKKVLMSGNMSDKCYVYFDKETPTISFTIGGTTYYADPDMTWEEWVNSSYNTGNYYQIEEVDLDGDSYLEKIITNRQNAVALNVGDSDPLDASTAIISGHNYQLIWNKKTIPKCHGIVFTLFIKFFS